MTLGQYKPPLIKLARLGLIMAFVAVLTYWLTSQSNNAKCEQGANQAIEKERKTDEAIRKKNQSKFSGNTPTGYPKWIDGLQDIRNRQH